MTRAMSRHLYLLGDAMEPDELQEKTEHALQTGQKAIGLTTAIVAVLLATVSLLSHRSHTEAILLLGKSVDEWNFYQAKHGRAHEYGALAAIAIVLPNGKDIAIDDLKKSLEEECGVPRQKSCTTPAKDLNGVRALMSELAEDDKGKHEGSKAAAGGTAGKGASATGTSGERAKEKPAQEAAVKEGALTIQERAREFEAEQRLAERRADLFDTGELFLQVSIVLCSIALLAGAKLYWRLSFISTAIGVGIAVWGWFQR